MRQMIAGLIAGVAFAATMATAAPAQACAVTDPCGNYGYYAYNHGCGYGACGVRQRLPNPAGPQYYWVNQGPTYTGPGNFAPVPTYQERAVIGSRYYGRPYRHYHRGYHRAYHRAHGVRHYHAHRHYGHRVKPLRYRY